MALPVNQKTVTLDEVYNAWTSFHAYIPEWMDRLGTKFYTFKNGELYEHDSNLERANFYGQDYGCRVEFSANENPSDIKLFKSMSLESNSDQWYATLSSEIESGVIGGSANLKFEDKEGIKYAYIRRASGDSNNYAKLSVLGIGNILTYQNADGNIYMQFGFDLPNQITNSINGDGDQLWGYNSASDSTYLITEDFAVQSYVMVWVNTSTVTTPSIGDFVFVVKSAEAESYGLRGYHSKITLINNSTGFVELYAANTEAFKSYM